jgi:hypothetical protein
MLNNHSLFFSLIPMKKILSACSIAALALAMVACKKDETDNLSRIKNYPSITLNGDALIVINMGETFTDPGATATLGNDPLQPIVNNPVDTSQPGLYVIEYKGANTEGDTIAQTRTVIVTDPVVNNLDQSGIFKRTGFADSPVTKVGNKGQYEIANFGFTNAPNTGFTATFVQIDASHIVVPEQNIEGLGNTFFTSVSSRFTNGLLVGITYAINAPSIFGNSPRTATRI